MKNTRRPGVNAAAWFAGQSFHASTVNVAATLRQQDTPEARFALAAMAVRDSHGGAPTASSEDGRIVFTYPDGTKTSGGRRIN